MFAAQAPSSRSGQCDHDGSDIPKLRAQSWRESKTRPSEDKRTHVVDVPVDVEQERLGELTAIHTSIRADVVT